MRYFLISIFTTIFVYSSLSMPTNFKTNFVQTITNGDGKVLTYEGNITFRSSKLFKWNYTQPTRKDVCTDGWELMIVDHDLEQVSLYFMNRGLNLAKVVSNATKNGRNSFIATYNEVEYNLATDSQNQLKKVVYKDDLDNLVNIEFNNMKYNLDSVEDEYMRCQYPYEYDVLKD